MPSGSLVTLADAKTYLNIEAGDTSSDAELQGFLDDAVSAVEDVIGPVAPQSYTETFDRHGWQIVLSHMPVQSVQSVSIQPWLGAAAIDDTAAWVVNTDTGVLRRNLTGGAMPFYGAGSVFAVTYTAGRASVPGPVNRAILMQVDRMWQSQRGAMPIQAGEEPPPVPYPGAYGFLGPDVMELLHPYLMPPGLA